jgi:hypothetical protein
MEFSLQSQITKNSSNSTRVDMINTTGTVIVSSYELRNCHNQCRKLHFPLAGAIKVYYGNNNVISSTSNMENISGGDLYSYN